MEVARINVYNAVHVVRLISYVKKDMCMCERMRFKKKCFNFEKFIARTTVAILPVLHITEYYPASLKREKEGRCM